MNIDKLDFIKYRKIGINPKNKTEIGENIRKMSQSVKYTSSDATRAYHCVMQSLCIFIFALGIVISTHSIAFAHGAERGLIMLLPTEFYLTGGGLTVLLSFLVLVIFPRRWFSGTVYKSLPLFSTPSVPKAPISLASSVLLIVCIMAGFLSVHDPLKNPLPLIVWTAWWVGLTLCQAIFGNLWPWLNPWTGILVLLRKLTESSLGQRPRIVLPGYLGYWPAIVQFAFFAWFELISLAPEDPPGLANAVLIYWISNLAAVLAFGEKEWFKRGEPFSVFFRMVGMFSPFCIGTTPSGKKIMLTWPGRKCLSAEPLPLSGALFILITLGTATFDGFSETFTWLGLIGINPLEFPGRSGVMAENALGLAMAPVVLASIFYASITTGFILAGGKSRASLLRLSGRLIYTIIPISIAFHSAHYFTQLLINGQHLIVVTSDPFALGWNLFGTADMYVTASFLQHLEGVRSIWTAQTMIIVVGHIAGIVVAHIIAIEEFRTAKAAAISQILLAAAMVFYTVFGLWLLSTPTAG